MRAESYSMANKDLARDKSRFVVRTSGIPGAGLGVFASTDLKNGTPIGLKMGSYINDAARFTGDLQSYLDSTSKVNTEYVMLRDGKKNYYLHHRLTRDVKKGEEVFLHYGAEQWIVMDRLQPAAQPNDKLLPAQIANLESFCVEIIGRSLKRALIVYLIYKYVALQETAKLSHAGS